MPAAIDAMLDAPPFDRATWGVLVQDGAGRTVYARNERKLMVPASVRKVFSAYTVMECLGPGATLATELRIDGPIDQGRLRGDVILSGDGDPSLGGRYDPNSFSGLDQLSKALRDRGVEVVEGDLMADVSAFDSEILHPTWQVGDLTYSWSTPVDALAWHENAISLHIDARDSNGIDVSADPSFLPMHGTLAVGDSGTFHARSDDENAIELGGMIDRAAEDPYTIERIAAANPGAFAMQALRESLSSHGIRVEGGIRVDRTGPSRGELVARVESPPVFLLLSTVLENSQNLYAEMLYKRTSASRPATFKGAQERERRLLIDEVGIPADGFRLLDGSGLSENDFVSPEAVVILFRKIDTSGARGIWREILASPGDNGTLRRRFPELKGRLFGKTGTLGHVTALAGIVETPSGAPFYFAFFVNHHISETQKAQAVVAGVVQMIADSAP